MANDFRAELAGETGEIPTNLDQENSEKARFDEGKESQISSEIDRLYDENGEMLSKELIEGLEPNPLSELSNMGCDYARAYDLRLPINDFKEYVISRGELKRPIAVSSQDNIETLKVPEMEKHLVTVPLKEKVPVEIRTSNSYLRITQDGRAESGLKIEVYSINGVSGGLNSRLKEQDLQDGTTNIINTPGLKPIMIDVEEIQPNSESVNMVVYQEQASVEDLNKDNSLAA